MAKKEISVNRKEGLELDLHVAGYYCAKVKACQESRIDFLLTLAEVRRLFDTKFCFYSGIALSHKGVNSHPSNPDRFTDLSLERIDNSIGYVRGNVKAVSYGFNQIKSKFENPNNPLEFEHLYKFAETVKKTQPKKKGTK